MQNESIGSAIVKKSGSPAHVSPEIHEQLELLREQHQEWVWLYEAVDPMVGEPLSVADLYRTAPNDFFKGVVGGILMMREALVLVTGRKF